MKLTLLSFIDDIANEISSIPDKLVPDFWNFLVQIIATLIMIVIVIFLGYKPIKKMLNERQSYVENQINEATTNNALAKQNVQASEEMVIAAKKEVSDTLANSKGIAEAAANKIIEEAHVEAARIKKDAEADIELSKKQALEDIHNEMVQVALLASREVLSREINESDDERLVEEFIKENN